MEHWVVHGSDLVTQLIGYCAKHTTRTGDLPVMQTAAVSKNATTLRACIVRAVESDVSVLLTLVTWLEELWILREISLLICGLQAPR